MPLADCLPRWTVLSDHFTTPVGACPTYHAFYDGLKEFEQDLHQHIHLENNILFPRAIEMEGVGGERRCLTNGLADFPVPCFERSFELEHEFSGVGAVDGAVIEAQAAVLH